MPRRSRRPCRRFKHRPSEYVTSGRYFQSIEIPEGAPLTNAVADLLGDEVLMYASDYPHGESHFPQSAAIVRGWDIPEERKRKLLWDNACGFTREPPFKGRFSIVLDRSHPCGNGGMGHEDAFPPPRLSARCRFSQDTFAGTRGNGRDAPEADMKVACGTSGTSPSPVPQTGAAYWTLKSICCRFEVCGRTPLGHRPRSTASAHCGLCRTCGSSIS